MKNDDDDDDDEKFAHAPVRLCCGQRHVGPVCPDGKVMCCICFRRVSEAELNRNQEGELEDVCLECAESSDTAGPKLGESS